ncbi:MAG: right-handed parallel beta-helix repeat-containing protein [Armatimonadetes bacterium]|nr:right-handed parallel beta-helix repeat-containing protein [Armatimonadota bacterium]
MLAVLFAAQLQQDISLSPGMVITRSATVMLAVYLFPNDNTDARSGTITIKGDNITVDFRNATLRGTRDTVDPDERAGTGVFIEGNNVTIKNLNVHGYKVGLAARDSKNLKIIDCDFSYNWKQRLMSTPEREDGSDWMSYHHNEEDEWLRYGAAIYLRGCDDFEVQGCTALGGQNGLMMTECNEGLVWNSNFSFLSSIGVGMYRSSRNRIMHNNIDWCVRGYSHGVYNRGQDSTGILVYEQSNDNVFAYNSVTHGGDGFFLWAGQTTMDTGEGGCNDNLLYGNDFSHAVANGIEATFSRNNFVNNLIMECWHGIWGGYSWESNVIGNIFRHNAEGIAWEHGQDNTFAENIFDRERMAINIWQKDSENPNWGYAEQRDTASRDNKFENNFFYDVIGPVFRISRSANVSISGNVLLIVGLFMNHEKEIPGMAIKGNDIWTSVDMKLPGTLEDNLFEVDEKHAPVEIAMQSSGNLNPEMESTGKDYLMQFAYTGWDPYVIETPPIISPKDNDFAVALRPYYVKPLEGGKRPFLKPGSVRGRKNIIIDEWGPYDFRSPKLVWRGKDEAGRLKFDVLGPFGAWTVKTLRGVKSISTEAGNVPGELTVELESGKAADILVELEFVGLETIDYRGIVTDKGRAVTFKYSEFFAPIDWTVMWFNYDLKTQDPRETDDWKTIILGKPAREESTDRLAYAWGGSPGEGVTGNAFLTLAEGSFEIQPGDYILELTSDDGVRVFVDGKVVHEDWTWHGPKSARISLSLGGKHTIRIEHFELDGYSTLKCELKRG